VARSGTSHFAIARPSTGSRLSARTTARCWKPLRRSMHPRRGA